MISLWWRHILFVCVVVFIFLPFFQTILALLYYAVLLVLGDNAAIMQVQSLDVRNTMLWNAAVNATTPGPGNLFNSVGVPDIDIPTVDNGMGFLWYWIDLYSLHVQLWWNSWVLWFTTMSLTTVCSSVFLCLKCLFVFLLIVLVRITTPKFKLETITKIGWIYSLTMLFAVFSVYWVGFFLF